MARTHYARTHMQPVKGILNAGQGRGVVTGAINRLPVMCCERMTGGMQVAVSNLAARILHPFGSSRKGAMTKTYNMTLLRMRSQRIPPSYDVGNLSHGGCSYADVERDSLDHDLRPDDG